MNKKMSLTLSLLVFFSVIGLSRAVFAGPDLYISEFALNPSTPIQGKRVEVRVAVYNKGDTRSGPFTLEWWPGENYKTPGCTWWVHGVAAKGGKVFICTSFYPSWYPKLVTKTVADAKGEVREFNENNNTRRMKIRVGKP